MAKLDEHHQSVQVMPLKRVPMGAITTLALNPMESNYSLAVGYESGIIELLKEQSNNNSLLHGKNNPVLSLAFSEQVCYYLHILACSCQLRVHNNKLVFVVVALETSTLCWSS